MNSKIALIAAMAKNRTIGKNNRLPWHLPADLKRFKELTLDKAIIMGRQTFLSLGSPLPQRHNIVLTHNLNFSADGIYVVHSIEEAIKKAKRLSAQEIMVIGGAQVYQQFLPFADRLYITWVDVECEGDSHFPSWNLNLWQEISREQYPADEKNPYPYTFVQYDRK